MTEKIALAAAMVHNELVADLHPDFFVELKSVAKAVKRLYYENKSITPNMVALKVEGPIDDIIVYYPTKEEGEEAIGLLKTEFQKRELKDGFEFAIKMLEKHPMDFVLKLVSDKIGSIQNLDDKRTFSSEELIEPLLEQMANAKLHGAWQPLLGIPHADEVFKGVRAGENQLWVAGAKVGKSSLVSRAIQYHLEENIPLYVASGELTEIDQIVRPLSSFAGHTTDEIEQGTVMNDPNFIRALDKLRNKKTFITNDMMSCRMMEDAVLRYKYLHGVTTFIFDQLNHFDEVRKDRSTGSSIGIQEVAAYSRFLAIKHKVCIIVFHQFNNAAITAPHFRGTENDAKGGASTKSQWSKLILLHRPEFHGLTEFTDGPFKGLRSKGLLEIQVGIGNRLAPGSALVKFIGEQQIIDIPDEFMSMGGKQIPLREAYYHGRAPEVTEDYPVFSSEKSSVEDILPF